MPLTTGQILNNRYRIVKLLGQGGFGAVYKAWDLNLKAACALKENLDTSEIAQRQFEHEATILASLHHPSLPRVTDHFFVTGQGQYLVMDFIQGSNLEELLTQTGTPVRPDQALDWIVQICAALTYLHSHQPPIIHRDIKPANIKITPDGRAVLVDFGIAKVYDPKLRTTAGARAVTPGFSPPEQYGFGKTDPRSDIYALGATLYKALTGHIPPESVERAIGTPLINPRQLNPAIPPRLEAVILQAMQPTPTGRFQSAADLKSALLGQTPLVTAPVEAVSFQPAMIAPLSPQVMPAALPVKKSGIPPWVWIGLAGVFGFGMVFMVGIAPIWNNSNNLRATQTIAALARADTRTAESQPEVISSATYTLSPPPSDIPDSGNLTLTLEPLTNTPLPTTPSAVATSIPTRFPTPTSTSTSLPSATSIPPALPTATSIPTALPTPTAVPLEPFIYDSRGVPMQLIPADSFTMGGDADIGYQACQELYINNTDSCARRQFEDANTLHTVILGNYYMDIFEVTNRRYADCVSAGYCSQPARSISETRPEYYGNSTFNEYPVIYLTWAQAESYCEWRGGRLPTEAEWERAAHGSDGRTYPWGNSFDGSALNFCDSSCASLDNFDWANLAYNDGYVDTAPVGNYSGGASPYGIYDLSGNVWEWIYDWYERSYYSYSDNDNPMGPPAGTGRVVRGGSWSNSGYVGITYYRDFEDPNGAYNNIGMRCVILP
jgi:serine/threonine protein kinase